MNPPRPSQAAARPSTDATVRAILAAPRFAVISDVHGNLGALRRVLAALDRRKLDQVICLGDVAGYGPQTGGCLAMLQERAIPCLRGNHDAWVGSSRPIPWDTSPAAAAGVRADRTSLNAEQRRVLGALPWTFEGGGFAFVHASYPTPRDWWYVLDPIDAELHLRTQPAPVSFFGHTHRQGGWVAGPIGVQPLDVTQPVTCREGLRYAFNPGSVGQPRDGDPRAAFLICDRENRRVSFHRVGYDVERAIGAGAAFRLPEALADSF